MKFFGCLSCVFFFSSRRRHTRFKCDWSPDVCSSDLKTNGMVDDATHQADQTKFEEVEHLADGLGPLYNAQSCRECHQNPVSGAASQVSEARVGHKGADGHFHDPEIPINHGAEIIKGRSLVNDRAICPNS